MGSQPIKARFDVPTVQRFAREGKLEEWVHTYLNAGHWANPGFSDGLKLQERWWIGPIEVELAALSRAVGPQAGMEYVVDKDSWYRRIDKMAQSMTDPLAIPPLIVEYRGDELSVRDGNTRHGAMSSKGWSTCWVLIWYNSEEDYLHHREQLFPAMKIGAP